LLRPATVRVAVAAWEGRVAPVFDVARRALVVEVADGEVVSEEQCALPGSDQVRALSELGVDLLICGAASRSLERRLLAAGVGLVPDVRGSVDEVVRAYLEDDLRRPRFSMPGCHAREQRGGKRRGRPKGTGRRG
jgi:predicted Fe-Mo cluster-binding NifX family protein